MTTKAVLILGAGARIGQSTALAFSSRGYRVIVAARSFEDGTFNEHGHLQLRMDLSKPEAVQGAFDKVKKAFHTAPSIVVYNAASRTVHPKTSPLSAVTLEQATHDMNVNAISPLLAAKYALEGFDTLPNSPASPKVFIFTGNLLNVMPIPSVVTFGMGKTAAANMLESLDGVMEYREKGYRFYYTDQRNADGSPAWNNVDGEATAKIYVDLAEGRGGEEGWWYTFAPGVGYRRFEQTVFEVPV